MNWSAIPKQQTIRLVGVVLAAGIGSLLLRNAGFYELLAQEAEGIATLTLLLGSVYAVMVAFVVFVIWGQFTEIENSMIRECGSLQDLVRFSQYLNPNDAHTIRRAIADYAQRVLRSEWESLSQRRRDEQSERAFAVLINTVVRAVPSNPAEVPVQERMIDMVRKSSEHRDERIAKSMTRIPPTLLWFVHTLAGALLALVFVYPFRHWILSIASFILIALVFFIADIVITDTDNPFTGVCNVNPEPFSNLSH